MNKVILMRGAPGSAKSYTVKGLTSNLSPDEYKICSADDYFIDQDGVYRWDCSMLGRAHARCRVLFLESLIKKIPLVIVDNCGIIFSDLKYYIYYGALGEYEVHLVESQSSWRNDPEECFRRNTHNVPLDTIKSMLSRYMSNQEVINFAKNNLNIHVKEGI